MEITSATLTPGSLLADRYVIERSVGAGAMAHVYRATDRKYDRLVAIKILRSDVSISLGVERFLAEIQVTSRLQHPNLLPLFDSGEADGLLYYVMPFIEGESLREKLRREKQLAVQESLHIALAILSALEYAHGRGVVHRDLKPENILLQAGEPIVADFGIALALSKAAGDRLTQSGVSLGTPQYMSPEQASGDRELDARTDIYAVGAILYEMLAGTPPHTAHSVQALLARVVTSTPSNLAELRPTIPDYVATAVERALQKAPADRWARAADFAAALKGDAAVTSTSSATRRVKTSYSRQRSERLLTFGALVALALVAVFGWIRATSAHAPTMAFTLGMRAENWITTAWDFPIAVSPDGESLVYIGRAGATGRQIYFKRMRDLEARPLAGTTGASRPTFSPDGQSIAFIADGKLRRISVGGGTSVEIESGNAAAEGWPRTVAAWSSRGVFVIAPNLTSGLEPVLYTIPELGGQPVRLTTLDTAAGEMAQKWPTVLADGKTILYTSIPKSGDAFEGRIGVVSLDDRRPRLLNVRGVRALGVIDDYLVYVDRSTIRAVLVDLRGAKATGQSVVLIEGVKVGGGGPIGAALSAAGTFAYVSGNNVDQELLLLHPDGSSKQLIDEHHDYDLVRASPDGGRVAVNIDERSEMGVESHVWILDRGAGTLTRLSTEHGDAGGMEWSPDGRTLFYETNVFDKWTIVAAPSDGSAPGNPVVSGKRFGFFAVHPNGQLLLYSFEGSAQGKDVVLVRGLKGDTTPHALAGALGDEAGGRFSPNGKLLAFESRQSGTSQVYVRPFPQVGPRVQVSTTQGSEPVWSHDGRRLYYRDGQRFVVADLETSANLGVVHRSALLRDDYDRWGSPPAYDVTPQGDLVVIRDLSERQQVHVIINWRDQVREQLRSKR